VTQTREVSICVRINLILTHMTESCVGVARDKNGTNFVTETRDVSICVRINMLLTHMIDMSHIDTRYAHIHKSMVQCILARLTQTHDTHTYTLHNTTDTRRINAHCNVHELWPNPSCMFTFWRVEMVYTGSLSLHITRHCIQRHDTYDGVMSQIQRHDSVYRVTITTSNTTLYTETWHATRHCLQRHDTESCHNYKDTTWHTTM